METMVLVLTTILCLSLLEGVYQGFAPLMDESWRKKLRRTSRVFQYLVTFVGAITLLASL